MAEDRSRLDCIVIGAGMAGLTFASLAARSGRRVLLVEQHYVPGGCFTAFRRGGFLFNVAVEWMTSCGRGQAHWRLLTRLGLEQTYRFHRLDTFKTFHLANRPARPIPLRCGRQPCEESLVDAFPAEQTGIKRFLDDCVAVTARTPAGMQIMLEVGLKPVEVMVQKYVADPALHYLLCSLVGYPNALGVLLMYIVGAACLGQLFVPADGDHRRLPVLLHRCLVSAGGVVRYGTAVDEILVRDRLAYGIRTSDGEVFSAPLIVAAIDRNELYLKLLRGSVATSRQQDRKIGASCYCLFLGLRRVVPAIGDHFAHMLLGDENRWQHDARDPEHAPMRVEQQSLQYEGLAPPGKSTMCLWLGSPPFPLGGPGDGAERLRQADELRANGARVAAVMLARVQRTFGIASDDVEVSSVATPMTFHRYTRNTGGSVTGHCLSESRYLARPSSGTPVPNVHHIGHWTTQSGVSPVMQAAQHLFDRLCPAVAGQLTGACVG